MARQHTADRCRRDELGLLTGRQPGRWAYLVAVSHIERRAGLDGQGVGTGGHGVGTDEAGGQGADAGPPVTGLDAIAVEGGALRLRAGLAEGLAGEDEVGVRLRGGDQRGAGEDEGGEEDEAS